MANPSQCLEEGAGRWPPRPEPGLYSEAQRLALEELVAGGPEALRAFLRREQLPPFLSEPEVQAIARGAVPPAAAEEEPPSLGASPAASSLTYFPERSDVEPPALELGWPGFAGGAFRGLTRVEAHFQPGCGDGGCGCKEAVRRQIRSARQVKQRLAVGEVLTQAHPELATSRVPACPGSQPAREQKPGACEDDTSVGFLPEAVADKDLLARVLYQVIAIVMDSFTDTDIFSDLQDAYNKRKVPVYILLDQGFLPYFLEMCKNLGVCPEQESLMRVRTLTGNTYYVRSGAKIIGKVHEKFMLIDGIRVTTGSYSFTWTDGKLNSCNLLVLSGQVVEQFDLQFRILYAQSDPISPKRLSRSRNSGMFDHLVSRTESSKEYAVKSNLRAEFARMSSTPKKMLKGLDLAEDTPGGKPCNLGHSCISEVEWFSDQEATAERKNASTQTGQWEEKPAVTVCNAVTQTNVLTDEIGTQTSVAARMTGTQTSVLLKTAVTQTKEEECAETPLLYRRASKEESFPPGKSVSNSSLRSLSSSSSQCSVTSSTNSLSSICSIEYSSSHRAEYFQKLHKERQFHYSTIRSKFSHMVDILSRRRRVPENYMNHYTGKCNLNQRRGISTSLRSLRDVSLFSLNK